MTIEEFANTLRDQVTSNGIAAESMVEDLEETRRSGLFQHISTAVHASVLTQYGQAAEQLLKLVPGDSVAIRALKHVKELSDRTSKCARPPWNH